MNQIQDFLNQRLRKRINLALRAEAMHLSEKQVLSEDTVGSLWQRIDQQLESSPYDLNAVRNPSDGFDDWHLSAWLRLIGLSFACTTLSIVSWSYLKGFSWEDKAIHQSIPALAGIKDGGSGSVMRLSSLRFARVNHDGSLTPGQELMKVTTADQLVFSVEASGIESQEGQAVRLSYRMLPEHSPHVVADYVLKNNQEVLQVEDGYIAFKPMRPGVYEFTLRSSDVSRERDDNVVGFSITVVKP